MEAPSGSPVAQPGMRSNPGMPDTAPAMYHNVMVLYSAVERVATVVDGARPGPNGRLFIVEPGKPTKVSYEAGRFILEHLAYTGVVRVEEVVEFDDDGNEVGTKYNVAAAKELSLVQTKKMDEMRWMQFVSDMVEDFIKRSKPVPPPPATILAIIERRGYRMQDYGIRPIGFQDPVDEKAKALAAENAAMKAQVMDLNSKLDLLLKQQAMKDQGQGQGQGNQAEPEVIDNASDTNVQDVPPSGGNRRSRQSRS